MKMDWLRTALIVCIALVGFLLVIRWNEFQTRNQPVEPASQISSAPIVNNDVPDLVTSAETTNSASTELNATENNQQPTVESVKKVRVQTDVLDVTIDTYGGDIVRVALPSFYNELNKPDQPFVLLDQTPSHTYIAKSGLVGKNGTDTKQTRPNFESSQSHYVLNKDQSQLNVDLTYHQSADVTITKRFSFKPGSHLITITYLVKNQSNEPWQGVIYGQIQRDSFDPAKSAGLGMKPFLGAATSTNEKNYSKFKFGDIPTDPQKHEKVGGWIAMVQHYFLSAWVPSAEDNNHYELFKQKDAEMYFLRFTGQAFSAAPGATAEKSVGFYAGPKDVRKLEEISPHLDLTVDYSFLWWLAKPIASMLVHIHDYVGNWGLAIVLLTFCIKLIFFYPSAVSYRSMAKMRKIQPKMTALKERCGDDKQKFSTEMMKLYRDEKVNPLSGCLPVLIQTPVFLALYWVLMESVQLRQAPLFLWIQDLSVKDPYYVLPLIMGATMWIQQRLNPTPPDPMQAKVMQFMPVFFTFLFLFFPAGLVLYYVVNNTLSITQQYVITKQIEKQN